MARMTSVFILTHLHVLPGGAEDVKLIGAYSSRELAIDAVARLCTQPGFRDYPRIKDPLVEDDGNGFCIDEYTLDCDHWTDGYVTV